MGKPRPKIARAASDATARPGIRRGALAVLAAVFVLVAASCSGAGDGNVASTTTSSSTSTSSPRVETTMTTMLGGGYEEPPDGGEVRVAEQGFTPGERSAVNADGHRSYMVSWGVVFENTSDYAAEIRPNVAYLDAAGHELGVCGCVDGLLFVPAGGSIAMSEIDYPETADSGAGPGVARIEVTVDVLGWWPVEPPEGDDPEAYRTSMRQTSWTIVRDATFARTDGADPVVSYSLAGEAIERAWAVIFRNANGDIVGGLYPSSETDGPTGMIGFDPTVLDLPGIDQAQIEVYVTRR